MLRQLHDRTAGHPLAAGRKCSAWRLGAVQPGRRAWADEAIRWASADDELIRASEQTLLAALR